MRVRPTSNIGLIGFMGTGKTTVGRALAKTTGRKFFDTDTIVEESVGKTISQIFSEEGEESFRRLEEKVVREACLNESVIISFGGGVVLSKSNVETIKQSSVVVLLRASVETILDRIEIAKNRPLLLQTDEPIEDRIRNLLDSRKSAYETAMDFAIDIDDLNIETVVEEIKGRLKI